MSEAFERYRGNGTTRSGQQVSTPGEEGSYLASERVVDAVNTALAIEQPLLVTGKPGTGKTVLAHSIAAELELGAAEIFAVRSDHHGRDLLYEIDNLQRFYDAQVGDSRARDRANYLRLGPLGKAFCAETQRVVLIDEIDKAPRDFPNDLLDALDGMALRIPELDIDRKAICRPMVVITSNEESQLPDPFLRRCVVCHIDPPNAGRLRQILDQRLGSHLSDELRGRIVDRFLELRDAGLERPPSTSEMLFWARALHKANVTDGRLEGRLRDLPYLEALLKNREDLARVRPRTD